MAKDRELESAERRSSSSTAPKSAVPLGPQQRLQSKGGARRIASGLEGPATVPLRSRANASEKKERAVQVRLAGPRADPRRHRLLGWDAAATSRTAAGGSAEFVGKKRFTAIHRRLISDSIR